MMNRRKKFHPIKTDNGKVCKLRMHILGEYGIMEIGCIDYSILRCKEKGC